MVLNFAYSRSITENLVPPEMVPGGPNPSGKVIEKFGPPPKEMVPLEEDHSSHVEYNYTFNCLMVYRGKKMYIYITVMQKTAILPQCRQSCSTPVHCLSRKLAMLIVKSYISIMLYQLPF